MTEQKGDIAARLRRAVERLTEKRDGLMAHQVYERERLNGKIEGVKLAASYIEEGERIFQSSLTPTPQEPCDHPTWYALTNPALRGWRRCTAICGQRFMPSIPPVPTFCTNARCDHGGTSALYCPSLSIPSAPTTEEVRRG